MDCQRKADVMGGRQRFPEYRLWKVTFTAPAGVLILKAGQHSCLRDKRAAILCGAPLHPGVTSEVSKKPLLTCSNPTQGNCNSLIRRRWPPRKQFRKPLLNGSSTGCINTQQVCVQKPNHFPGRTGGHYRGIVATEGGYHFLEETTRMSTNEAQA